MAGDWKVLNERIIDCRRCERLLNHCQQVAQNKRKAYQDDTYWGRPVPNLGPSRAPLLIVGLAPGAHGANRTGRMFTGDRSGDWLFRALHRAGFANQALAVSRSDGLKMKRCAITAVCHCAPPDNKPNADEIANCRGYLVQTLEHLNPRIIVALGGLAWKSVIQLAIEQDWLSPPRPKFSHGNCVSLGTVNRKRRWLIGSYHPSQQNTFTGRLTEKMLDQVFQQASQLLTT